MTDLRRKSDSEPNLSPLSLHTRLTKVEEHTIAMMAWRASIEESTEVNKEMVDIGKALLRALSWVAVMSKWITAVSAAIAFLWIGIKHLAMMAR